MALALAIVGVVAASSALAIHPMERTCAWRRRSSWARVFLSVAPRLPGFDWAHAHLPGLGAIRAYARAGQIVMIGLGLLAAAGTIALRGRWISDRRWPVVAGALILLVNAEALRAPMWYSPFEGIPSIYDVLQSPEHVAVLELPIYRRALEFPGTPATWSTPPATGNRW